MYKVVDLKLKRSEIVNINEDLIDNMVTIRVSLSKESIDELNKFFTALSELCEE